ncbi:tetratricopeptide repeat protein [Treponema primitia ZAS-2]|uniref:Tetratricopeptide repeat protein n=1 Tax=Treponema primitia (strain ATCC BAA-887 / DSM 12427 / ZAS-2) TaxID=545694 RepID=F5YRA8_TREPZ|nr:tetratricopeptide repeat protein [Treponema primitia]AEF86424.1 tetratricopeptide repeat protein [Treponema primitia ZAS-2]
MLFAKKGVFTLICVIFFAGTAFGQSSFSQGEDLFLHNKPQEALSFLEAALAEDPGNVKACIYLGVSYQQLKRPDEAVVVYNRALPVAGEDAALIAFNLGNAYYAMGNLSLAEESYTQAVAANPDYASAYLNRANAKLTRQALQDAISDYELYLSLEPLSAKRNTIEKLISFIHSEFAAAERERILAEARAAAEAERKKRILEEVAASLQSAAEDTTGLSSGSEEVLGYDGEFELE